MSILYAIIVFQNESIQAVYNRESKGKEFDTKNSESLRNFLAEFLSVDVDGLYELSHSPFGRHYKVNHNESDSTIYMTWEYIDN